MDFKTCVPIADPGFTIDHSSRMMLFGSCFSENIGLRLNRFKFQSDINPFGILYNPLSIAASIRRLLSGNSFSAADLVKNSGLYHSFMHHGSFSDRDSDRCLSNISQRFDDALLFLKSTDIYIITFGTAYIYRLKGSETVVANCHKFPDDNFLRLRLSVEEIVEEWHEIVTLLSDLNPDIKLIFTVSPIRHIRDGAHENQVSKSILHLAVDSLGNSFTDKVFYFPAYEIMIDELRDYRFYDRDMIHPSPLALDYIWELFSERFFSDATKALNIEWEKLKKAVEHRPLYPDTQTYRRFLEQTLNKLNDFAQDHPEFSSLDEINHITSMLNLLNHKLTN